MSTPPANESLEYLKMATTLAVALLGGLLFSPLVEKLKDVIGASRAWKNQRAAIVSRLRLILGVLAAFNHVANETFGQPETSGLLPSAVRYNEISFARLVAFDLTPVTTSLEHLSALHPEESAKSGVGQYLIQNLVLLCSYCEQLKELRPISVTDFVTKKSHLDVDQRDYPIVTGYREQYTSLLLFLSSLYAPRMGIQWLSISIDQEVMTFERFKSQQRLQLANEQLDNAHAKHKAFQDSNALQASDEKTDDAQLDKP